MAEISKVTLPSGTIYDIKDQTARDAIASLSGYTKYLGVTTTALTDGATTNPITIGGASVTAENGNIVNYGSKEFIFNGTAWQEFGDISGLKALAFKDSASGSVTVTTTSAVTNAEYNYSEALVVENGTVLHDVTATAPTFTGTQKYLHLTGTKGTTTSTGNFTPAGTVSKPTFTGTQGTVTVTDTTRVGTWLGIGSTYQDAISAAQNRETATDYVEITPAGWIGGSEFVGMEGTVSGSVTPNVSTTIGTGSTASSAQSAAESSSALSYADITPVGTVSTPTITVTPATSTKYSITGLGTLPTFSATVSDEVLTLGWTKGALPTRSSFTAVTGITSATSTQPTFTGTAKYIASISTGEASNFSTTFTPQGYIDGEEFNGTPFYLATYTHSDPGGGEVDISATGTFTPSGTVSQPTFTGTQGSVSVSTTDAVTAVSGSVNTTASGGIDIKPAGTVSAPTLTKTSYDLGVNVTKGTTTSTGTVTVS